MKNIFYLMVMSLVAITVNAQYQVASTSVAGKKTVTTTVYDKGYVIKLDGERLEGNIQLKIVNNDTVEVRYKDDSKNKIKFSRYDLSSFGLSLSVDDQKVANNPGRNFNPGYIMSLNGDKIEGKVALRYSLSDEADQLNRRWFVQRALVDIGDGSYKIYTTEDIDLVSQTIDGVESIYEKYKDGFSKRLADGALVLLQNPYPTTVNEFASSLAEEVQQSVAEEVAKAELKQAMKGKSNTSLQDIQENYDNNSSGSTEIYQKEYMVRFANSNNFVILNKKQFDDWAEQTFASCSAFRDLEKSQQRAFTNMKNIEEAIQYYNSNCGN